MLLLSSNRHGLGSRPFKKEKNGNGLEPEPVPVPHMDRNQEPPFPESGPDLFLGKAKKHHLDKFNEKF